MKLFTKIGLVVAAIAGVSVPASATVFDITLSGTFATGVDDLGLFFPTAHTPLVGDAFSIEYILTVGPETVTTDSDGVSPLYKYDTSGDLQVKVTINGKTFAYTGTAQSVYDKTDHAASGGNPAFSRIDFNTYDGINSINQSLTVDNAPLGPLAGFSPGSLGHSSLNMSLFGGAVRGSSVDSIAISTVPELASWMLMVGGLGAVGAALRRRKPVFVA